jgi:hypothetical protein
MFSGDQLRWPPDKKRPSSGFTVTGPLAGTSKRAVDRVHRRHPAFLESDGAAEVERDQVWDRHDRVEAEEEGGGAGIVDDFGKLLVADDRRAPPPRMAWQGAVGRMAVAAGLAELPDGVAEVVQRELQIGGDGKFAGLRPGRCEKTSASSSQRSALKRNSNSQRS